MTLVRLAFAHLRAAPLTTVLNILLLALGTASIAILMLVAQQLSQNLTRNAENVDLVLGAKGSPIQLVLSSVYHADIPTGNIHLAEAQRWANDRRIAAAAPLSLGDSVRGYRIVGTTSDIFKFYAVDMAQGEVWDAPLEAVLGADAADAMGLRVGDTFSGAHGLSGLGEQHDETPYRVTGVLAYSGSVVDRLVLTSLDSVWQVHGEHDHHDEEHHEEAHHEEQHHDEEHHEEQHYEEQRHDEEHVEEEHHDALSSSSERHEHEPAANIDRSSREITAMLLRYKSPVAAASMPRQINRESDLQAAAPAFELARLLQLIGVGLDVLKIFALILVASAALSIFASLYSALNQRRGDLAMMRCLGATRYDLMLALLIEGLLLAILGVVLGLLLGHGVVELMGQALENSRGVRLTGMTFLSAELTVVGGLLLVGLLAAALPAWQAYRTDVSRTLAQS